MPLSSSHLDERAAARSMIAAATDRFLAEGNEVLVVPQGATGETAQGLRALRIAIPGKPKAEPKAKGPRPERKPDSYRESIKRATFARTEADRKARDALALKAAVHASLGDTLSKTADALGVTRVTLRKACAEHGIKFQTQA